MQLNKFWLIILGLGLILFIINRTKILNMLPGAKKEEKAPVPRDYLNEAMYNTVNQQHNIKFQQS